MGSAYMRCPSQVLGATRLLVSNGCAYGQTDGRTDGIATHIAHE